MHKSSIQAGKECKINGWKRQRLKMGNKAYGLIEIRSLADLRHSIFKSYLP